VAGFVSVLICMESIPRTDHAFDIAVLRTLETGLGMLCYTLVMLLVWSVSSASELDAAARPRRDPAPALSTLLGVVRAAD
jgi:uncharacterized membrane protein YccC